MPEATLGRKAIALAYRQGYAKGMQQGARKGLQKGIKEGRKKGVIDGMRYVIVRQIRQRFGPPPVTLLHRLERIAEAALLERIARELLKAKDVKRLEELVAYGDSVPKRKVREFSTRPEGPTSAVSPRRPRRLAPVRYPH